MCDFEPDDGFMEDEPFDDDPFQDDGFGDTQPDDPASLDWQDIAFLGAMAEEIGDETQRQKRKEREMVDYAKRDDGTAMQ